MKKSHFLIPLCTFLCCILFFTSCRENTAVLDTEIANPQEVAAIDQDFPKATFDAVFDHLSTIDNLADLSMQEQYIIMQNYARANGLHFNIQKAVSYYEDAMATQGQDVITVEEDFLLNELNNIKDLIQRHGFTPPLVDAIQVYKTDLTQFMIKDHEVNTDTYKAILSIADQTILMVTDVSFRRYIDQMDASFLHTNLDARFNWGCFWASLALAGAIAGCAAGNLGSCLSIFLAELNVLKHCGDDGGYVDPCLNSPNPCCGITCIQGYMCNASGNCVPDTSYDCNITGCLPGEQCLNGLCVPF